MMQSQPVLLAADDSGSTDKPAGDQKAKQDDSPEAKMNRRFPQKIKTADLLTLEVIDDDNRVFGKVVQVVRSPEGKIKLVVLFDRWLQLFGGRPVAVPIEVVAIVGRQVASLDMKPDDYKKAPSWVQGNDQKIPDDELIRIALARR